MSPWWYRGRTWVFAVIYFLGFFIGGFSSGLLHHSYVPAYREIGHAVGPNGSTALLIFAVVCGAICYFWRLWGSSYLRAPIVWSADARTDTLIVAGPFRYVRNPLYLGNMFLALGVGLMAPVWGTAVIFFGNLILVIALARHEETVLENRYGDAFRRYAARVPSLVPRIIPIPAQGEAHFSLGSGLTAEIFTGAMLLGIVLALVDRRTGGLYFFVCYAAGIVLQSLVSRRSSA